MKYPYILVLHEKYGDAFYVMNGDDDVSAFALELLTTRFNEGMYEKPDTPDSIDDFFQKVHGMTLADAQEMREKHGDTIRIGNRTAANEIESMKQAYVYKLEEAEEYNSIEQAVNSKDGNAAWEILQHRSAKLFEYEDFSIEQIQNIKTTEGTN